MVGLTAGLWFVFTVAMGTANPLYVVSSGSMRPVLEVGDLIVVKNGPTFGEVRAGDIIVFRSPTSLDRIIVHRILRIVDSTGGERQFITKGDNNGSPDGWMVGVKEYVGKVVVAVPKIGLVSSLLAPPVNYLLIAIILVFIFVGELYPSKEKGSK